MKLSEGVRAAMTAQGVTWQDLADKLDVNVNSLRAWCSRDLIPEWAAQRLARWMALTSEEFRERFEYSETAFRRAGREHMGSLSESGPVQPEDPLAIIDSRLAKYPQRASDVSSDSDALVKGLRPGDIRVYWSIDREPWEFSTEGGSVAGAEIAEAGKRGARLVYLYPDSDVCRMALSAGFRRPLRMEDYDQFRAELLTRCSTEIDVRVLPCGIPAFLIPRFSVTLYALLGEGSAARTYRALAYFPAGTPEREVPLHLPLDRIATDRVIGFVRAVLSANGAEDLIREL